MRTSVRPLVLSLALLAGCTGDVSGSEDVESDSPETLNGWREDVRAWRDWWRSRRDGGTSPTTRDSGVGPVLDAGAPSEPDPVEPDPVEPDPIEPGPTVGTCPNGQPQPGAAGLRIREVALYQTLKVSLYRDGAWRSQRELPVVQGKKALARVFVDTLPGYARHGVRGVLTGLANSQSWTLCAQRQPTSLCRRFTFVSKSCD